jgi:hypothetical protein
MRWRDRSVEIRMSQRSRRSLRDPLALLVDPVLKPL